MTSPVSVPYSQPALPSPECTTNQIVGRSKHDVGQIHARHDSHPPRARSVIVGTCATAAIAADNRHNRTRFVCCAPTDELRGDPSRANRKTNSEISDPPITLISPVPSTVRSCLHRLPD